jgi:hypothetical protein
LIDIPQSVESIKLHKHYNLPIDSKILPIVERYE